MRVALVSPYDLGAFGGVQDQVLKLAAWLRDEGHAAWVVGPGDGPDGTISVGDVRVIEASGSRTPISLSAGVGRRVRDAAAAADVMHVHEPLMPLVSLAATLRIRAPSVGTFHADAPRWVRWSYRRSFSFTGGRVGRLDVVTAVSPVAGASLRTIPHLLIPNGLDTAQYTVGPKEGRRVTFLGRDDPRKGLDVFEDAARLITARVPDASFVVAGTDRTGRVGAIEYVGRVSEEHKRELLAGTDVFVAPHRGFESFGIVLAEAMAAGCAVVASALPGFAYVLGDAGELVAPGDHVAIADAVARLLTDDDARHAHQQSAVAAANRFDRSVVVAAYLDAYEAAMSAHRA